MRPINPATKVAMATAVTRYEKSLDLAGEYLSSRGFEREDAERFRLGVVAEPLPGHEMFTGRLCIPGLGADGDVRSIRFRSLDNDVEPRYLGLARVETLLYNVRAVTEAANDICIAEGEFDAMTLNICGFPAAGVVGASNWKPRHPRVFAGFSAVYVFGDGDKAGREFAHAVAKDLPSARTIPMPEGADVNQVYTDSGVAAVAALLGEAGWGE